MIEESPIGFHDHPGCKGGQVWPGYPAEFESIINLINNFSERRQLTWHPGALLYISSR
jgi:hypothetical protein